MKKILLITSIALSLNVSSRSLDDRTLSQLKEGQLLVQSLKQASLKKGVTVVTVGADINCDYRVGTTKIQDAINSGAGEIRIAMNDTYNENLLIDDRSTSLRGGFADCTEATNNNQTVDYTEISGVDLAGAPVVLIQGSTQRNTIAVENITLTNGTSGFFVGGGISTASADAQINLTRTNINGNTGFYGGGISVLSGNTDISAFDVRIESNTADVGGGLYCSGNEASFFMDGTSAISINSAVGVGAVPSGQGGGVYLSEGCSFTNYSGNAPGFFNTGGIAFNQATAQGGGIYADTGASATLFGHQFCFFFCSGNNDFAVPLLANRSDSDATGDEDGGGAFITGADTVLNIYAGEISFNISGEAGTSGDGAGIHVADTAEFTSGRLFKDCWDQDRCNVFSYNTAGHTNGNGAAIYNDGGSVDVFLSYFEFNRGTHGLGVFSIGTATNRLEGNIFNNNGDSGADGQADLSLFWSNGAGSTMDIMHNTIADNNVVNNIFDIGDSSGDINVLSSIVHESVEILSTTTATTVFDCVIAHETTSISGFLVIADDPEFVDRANGDYHLDINLSPAVDYCDNFNIFLDIQHKDIDFEDRGFDDPRAGLPNRPFDIGADEASDIIFKHDFDPNVI